MQFCHRLQKLKPSQMIVGKIKLCAEDFQVEEIDEAGLPCSELRSLPQRPTNIVCPAETATLIKPNAASIPPGVLKDGNSESRHLAANQIPRKTACPTKQLTSSQSQEFLNSVLTPPQVEQLRKLSHNIKTSTSRCTRPIHIFLGENGISFITANASTPPSDHLLHEILLTR